MTEMFTRGKTSMTNLQDAEKSAIAKIEQALINAGWSDGWSLSDDEVRNAPSPIFYRNYTSAVAGEARVSIDGQTHNAYVIYNIIANDPNYAENKPFFTSITVCLTFYYDEAHLFDSEQFAPFMKTLMNELADDLWVLSGEGESAVPATDDGKAYINRKIVFATNNF